MRKLIPYWSRRVFLGACLVMALCLSAFATGEGSGTSPDISGVTTALTDGLTSLVPTILTAVGAIAVAGLAIFGAKFAVAAGLAMFRKVTGRQ